MVHNNNRGGMLRLTNFEFQDQHFSIFFYTTNDMSINFYIEIKTKHNFTTLLSRNRGYM